jgi:hypothetical protein
LIKLINSILAFPASFQTALKIPKTLFRYPYQRIIDVSISYQSSDFDSINMCHTNSNNILPINILGPEQPGDTWYCGECGTLNADWYDVCPVCGKGTK